MRSRWSSVIRERGSSLSRHSRIAPGAWTSTAPCCTSTPASVAVTLFVIDQPGSAVSGVIPSAYRSATSRPSCSTTTASVWIGGDSDGCSKASSRAASSFSGSKAASRWLRSSDIETGARGGVGGAGSSRASSPWRRVQPVPGRWTARCATTPGTRATTSPRSASTRVRTKRAPCCRIGST